MIKEPEKTDPDQGVKKAPDPESGSSTLVFEYTIVYRYI
jgi:hypothetical protein